MLKHILFTFCAIFSLAALTAENKSGGKNFHPFTGKISGNKVRLRTGPSLDSHIVRQMKKDELVLIVGEENDFWSVKAPYDIKAYVYRAYVIDNTVEADRVNLRLQPNTEAPILGQLRHKDKIEGQFCNNNKWLEIQPPDSIRFYIAKEYIIYAGDSDYLAKMQKKQNEVQKLVNSAYFLTQAECKKPYNEMTPQEAISQFEAVIRGYPDFPEYVQQAKEGLALLQDNYLQKKIAYLENKADLAQNEKEEIFKQLSNLSEFSSIPPPPATANSRKPVFYKNLTEKMRFWQPIEETLFSTWNTFHPDKSIEDFYKEQKVNAIVISGKLEKYGHLSKNRPGDYILKKGNLPIAYLYSTMIDLEQQVGREIKVQASPRPNNNFAFPAYFVNAIE